MVCLTWHRTPLSSLYKWNLKGDERFSAKRKVDVVEFCSVLVNNPSFKRGLSPRPRLATHLLLLPAPPDKMTSVVSVVVAWGRLQPSQRKYQNLLRYQNRKVDGRLVRKPVNFWLNFPSGEDIILSPSKNMKYKYNFWRKSFSWFFPSVLRRKTNDWRKQKNKN